LRKRESFPFDDRLPPPGTVITRAYKGESLHVKVLPHGFEFEGEVFKSLSAAAKAITGQHCLDSVRMVRRGESSVDSLCDICRRRMPSRRTLEFSNPFY
jgi:hypothetical protein